MIGDCNAGGGGIAFAIANLAFCVNDPVTDCDADFLCSVSILVVVLIPPDAFALTVFAAGILLSRFAVVTLGTGEGTEGLTVEAVIFLGGVRVEPDAVSVGLLLVFGGVRGAVFAVAGKRRVGGGV